MVGAKEQLKRRPRAKTHQRLKASSDAEEPKACQSG